MQSARDIVFGTDAPVHVALFLLSFKKNLHKSSKNDLWVKSTVIDLFHNQFTYTSLSPFNLNDDLFTVHLIYFVNN